MTLLRDQPLRVGLLGTGAMGQNHLRVLSSLAAVDLRWISDLDREKSEQLSLTHPVAIAQDLDQALTEVEAVVICTPAASHLQDLLKVSSRVKNVFVEKPLAANLDQCLKALAIAQDRGINVQVGFIERFNPVVQALCQVIRSNHESNPGKPVHLDFFRTNRLSSRIQDVDVVVDLMIHDIDLALMLNGPIRAVSALGTLEDFSGSEPRIGFATAQLEHENGALTRLLASRVTDKKIRRIEVTCHDKFIECELFRKEIFVHRQSQMRERGETYGIETLSETVEVRHQEALLSELQAFIRLCRGVRGAQLPTAEDGVAAMRVCDQIIQLIYANSKKR